MVPQYLVLGLRYFAFNKATVQLILGLMRYAAGRRLANAWHIQVSVRLHVRYFKHLSAAGSSPSTGDCSTTSAPTGDFARRRAMPPRTRSVAILEKTRILRRPIGFNISLRGGGAGTCSRRGTTSGVDWILLTRRATYPPGGGVAARCI